MKQKISISLLLLLVSFGSLLAQDYLPGDLKTHEEHSDYIKTIHDAHQELLQRESPVLLKYGYESTEHLALRDSILKRNALLLAGVNTYLDTYGFPRTSAKILERRQAAQQELMKKLVGVPLADTLARDSILQEVSSQFRSEVTALSLVPTIMLVLGTETDFYARCEMISLLRFEWEEDNLSVMSMLAYMRHTYAIKHGKELDIATGTTERERIYMYGRELSGCWVE
ncbi:MAG: hypothetical protein AB8H12_15680 [Lewinella sp.]